MQALKNSLLLAVALVLGTAACGRDNGQSNGQPDGGYGAYKLALVGAPVLTLHPNDKRTLQVGLAQEQIGGVANADISFEFDDGDPANAKLDAQTVQTDTEGVATIRFTAGNTSPGGFKIVATAPKFKEARPVAFSVRVVPIARVLQIVGAPQVVVSQAGDSAKVNMFTSSSIGLKIRELDKDTGAPIAGDTITFNLPTGTTATSLQFSGATNPRQATAVTNAGGEAQVFLISSAAQEANTLVTAYTNSSGSQGSVSFSVTATTGSQGQVCTNSQQCPAGTICVNGHCQTDSGGSCNPGGDTPCPFGYVCDNGVCKPPTQYCSPNDPNSCPSGQQCKCTNPADASTCTCVEICPNCPAGTVCNGNPNNPQCIPIPTGLPDVTGVWYTRHMYDIRQALPPVVRTLFTAIRIIDQAIVGKLSWPSWVPKVLADYLNKLISRILKQYIPPWVQTVIRIGDDIATILSDLRSEGAMRLQRGADPSRVKGTEVWTSLVFYWLGLCGDNIGGDPRLPPECARFDINTTDNDIPNESQQCKGQTIPTIAVQVGPVTGAIAGTGAADSPYRLMVDQRQVKLQMGKVVLVVINQLLTLTTPYHCIQEATDCNSGECIVDCEGLGADVANLIGIPEVGDIVAGICMEVVTLAGEEVTKLLASVTFETDALDFAGGAVISKVNDASAQGLCDSGTNCAGQLGKDDFATKLVKDTANRDGKWDGSFFLKLIKGMPGAWEGTRQPVHP